MMLASLSWCTIQYQEWEFYKGRRDVGERIIMKHDEEEVEETKKVKKSLQIYLPLPQFFHVFVLLLSVIFDIKKSFLSCLHCSDLWFFFLPHHIAMQLKQVFFFKLESTFRLFFSIKANKISISSTTMHLAPLTLLRFPSSSSSRIFSTWLYEKPNIFLIHYITLHLLKEIIVKKGLLAALNSSHTHQHY